MITPELLLDIELILRIILAILLGGIIGWERERHQMSAGIRTYGSICMGACLFGIISMSIPGADPSRVAAQVATGIGFLGGGLIFREGSYVSGLTTAATLWATAAVGVAISVGMYMVGILTSIIMFFLLYLPKMPWWKKISGKAKRATSSN